MLKVVLLLIVINQITSHKACPQKDIEWLQKKVQYNIPFIAPFKTQLKQLMAKLLECFQCLSKASTELMTRDQWKRMELPRRNPGVSDHFTLHYFKFGNYLKYGWKSCISKYFKIVVYPTFNITIHFFILSAFDCDLKDLPILEGILKQILADNPTFFRYAINH